MATLTLCSDGYGIADQVFTIELEAIDEIQAFVGLVKHGGISSGLIKPAINIVSNDREQTLSSRNDWSLDKTLL